jgi:hypothetical protein
MALNIGIKALIPAAVLQSARLPNRHSRKNPHWQNTPEIKT